MQMVCLQKDQPVEHEGPHPILGVTKYESGVQVADVTV